MWRYGHVVTLKGSASYFKDSTTQGGERGRGQMIYYRGFHSLSAIFPPWRMRVRMCSGFWIFFWQTRCHIINSKDFKHFRVVFLHETSWREIKFFRYVNCRVLFSMWWWTFLLFGHQHLFCPYIARCTMDPDIAQCDWELVTKHMMEWKQPSVLKFWPKC